MRNFSERPFASYLAYLFRARLAHGAQNASQQIVREFASTYCGEAELTVREYAVDYDEMAAQHRSDCETTFDLMLHTGQAARAATIELESIALNIRTGCDGPSVVTGVVIPDGATAYQSDLPLDDWSAHLQQKDLPAMVSFHAGTYLCNALLYRSLHHRAVHGGAPATFVHFPLAPDQDPAPYPGGATLETAIGCAALQVIVDMLAPSKLA